MYPPGNELVGAACDSQAVEAKLAYSNRTIGENIDMQIEACKKEIARLEGVRKQLRNGASMADMRIEDLRRVMQY